MKRIREEIRLKKMRKKVFMIGVLTCLVFGVFTAWSAAEEQVSPQENTVKTGRIEIDDYKWDIGDVQPERLAKKTFLIKNVGEGELFIESVRTTCSCIKTNLSTNRILPKQRAELETIYDSTGREEGPDQKRIYICSNDSGSPRVLIEVRANIIPAKKENKNLFTNKNISQKEENVFLSPRNKSTPVNIYIFVDTECEECVETVEKYITPIILKRNIQTIELDISKPDGFELLLSAEEFFKKKTSIGPAILFNDDLMGEDEIISGRFEEKVESYEGKILPFFNLEKLQKRKPLQPPDIEAVEIETILFSTRKYCGKCRRMEKYLALLKKRYPKFSVKTFYIEDAESALFYEYLGGRFDIPKDKILYTPAFIIGTRYFTEIDQYHPGIEKCVQETGKKEILSGNLLYEDFKKSNSEMLENKILKRFKNFKALPVAIAGVIDGINPCAFATIIFFVTSLFVVRKEKKTILAVGFLFIAVTFLTYFLIGVSVLKVSSFLFIKQMGPFIYLTAAMVLFVLAYLSLADCINYCRGRKDKMILQLSEEKKRRISRLISKNLRLKHIAGAIVITAFIVSITELTCTGQIYLPTILYILKMEQLKYEAISLLCLYNFAFILPLIVVFFAFFFIRSGSYQFIRLIKQNVAIAKFLLFLCFLSLGIIFLIIR